MAKTRTQKYIDKFCEYIDRLIAIWEGNESEVSDTRIFCKIEFIASILGFKGRFACHESINIYGWNNLEWYRAREKEDYENSKKNNTSFTGRVDILNKYWKQQALEIKPPIKSIESYDYRKKDITQEKINRLLDSLKYMQVTINSGVCPQDINMYGKNANNTVVEMGLLSLYREIAIRNGLISSDKLLPYNSGDWPDYRHENLINWPPNWESNWQPSSELKAKIKKWTNKANSLLKSLNKTQSVSASSSEISLSDLKNPVPCSEIAGIVRLRSDNVARTLKSHKYLVVKAADKYYCDAEQAGVVWPKWKKHWQEKQRDE